MACVFFAGFRVAAVPISGLNVKRSRSAEVKNCKKMTHIWRTAGGSRAGRTGQDGRMSASAPPYLLVTFTISRPFRIKEHERLTEPIEQSIEKLYSGQSSND